jgi:hypothetical protein
MSGTGGIQWPTQLKEKVTAYSSQWVPAQRVPLSGAAGGLFTGDVWIGDMKAEVKARSHGSGFKTLEKWLGNKDLLFLRRDRKALLVA